MVVIAGDPVAEPSRRPLLAGVADRLALAGHDVASAEPGARTGEPGEPDAEAIAVEADVLVLPRPAAAAHRAVLAHRAGAGRPTVLVVEADDEPGDLGDLVDLVDLGPGLVAVAADPAVVEHLRRGGVPAQVVPVMSPIARQDALREAADAPVASAGGVIGWTIVASPIVAHADDAVDAVGQALATGLIGLLDERPDLRVEIVADGPPIPGGLADHPQVRPARGRPDPGEQARWTVHAMTAVAEPAPTGLVLTPLLEAAHAGVPTLLTTTTARAVGGLADPRLVVADPTTPDAWTTPLRLLLDRDDRPARSARAREVGQALERPEATDLVIDRLLGWLDREAAR